MRDVARDDAGERDDAADCVSASLARRCRISSRRVCVACLDGEVEPEEAIAGAVDRDDDAVILVGDRVLLVGVFPTLARAVVVGFGEVLMPALFLANSRFNRSASSLVSSRLVTCDFRTNTPPLGPQEK